MTNAQSQYLLSEVGLMMTKVIYRNVTKQFKNVCLRFGHWLTLCTHLFTN